MAHRHIKLYFSDGEILHYLQRKGYAIQVKTVRKSTHIHGSRYEYYDEQEITAHKDGTSEDYVKAFTTLIKAKLLTL